MSIKNVASGRADKAPVVEGEALAEAGLDFQLLQTLNRVQHQLSSMENRFGERLASLEERLVAIEARLARGRGAAKKVVSEKPNVRNWLNAQLTKGWTSETEIIEKTGWQTIGVRSFVTKARTLGLSVEQEERDGVPFYRFAR